MDYVKLVYSIVLLVSGILIFFTPMFQKGDERKQFINSKAQSYIFFVVVGMLILDVLQSIYFTIQGKTSYTGAGNSPLVSLTLISIVYVVTYLIYRKKYGN